QRELLPVTAVATINGDTPGGTHWRFRVPNGERISEVVRGEDLLVSTFRQLLLYRALNLTPPQFSHTQLVVDESGKRLAKRHGALSLRALRERGAVPGELRAIYLSSRA